MELPVSGGPTATSARRPSNTPGARAVNAAPGSKGADGAAGPGSAAEAMDTSSETDSAGGGVNGGQGVCGEFEVVLKRESGEGGALGLSLAGGAQTAIRAVVVHELFGPGAAARDGRLKHGDHILEVDARLMFLLCLQRHSVCAERTSHTYRIDAHSHAQINGQDMRQASREDAVGALRLAGGEVRIRVLRPERPLDRTMSEEQEDYFDVFTVELQKKKAKGLGLSIVGRQLPGTSHVLVALHFLVLLLSSPFHSIPHVRLRCVVQSAVNSAM